MPRGKSFTLNQHYFDSIDNPNKAYILGLIYSDGNISNGLDSHYRLRITLQNGDKEILDRVKDELEFTGTVKVRELKNKKTALMDNKPLIAELSISNKYMITRLKELGVVPAKSLICTYPNIPEEFDRDFIRGFFDGDGSIYERNEPSNPSLKKGMRIEILSGSHELFWVMLRKIQKNVEGITDGGVHDMKTKIRITKDKRQALRILSWLYEGSELYLDRKYQKYCYFRDKFLPPSSERAE